MDLTRLDPDHIQNRPRDNVEKFCRTGPVCFSSEPNRLLQAVQLTRRDRPNTCTLVPNRRRTGLTFCRSGCRRAGPRTEPGSRAGRPRRTTAAGGCWRTTWFWKGRTEHRPVRTQPNRTEPSQNSTDPLTQSEINRTDSDMCKNRVRTL